MRRLTAYSTQSMDDPQAGFAPIRTAAIDNINRNYMKVGSRLGSSFAARGYGSSGGLGDAMLQTEFQRGGDLSNLEGEFGKAAIEQKRFGAGLGTNLLNFGRGSTTTGTTPDTSLSNGLLSGGNALSNLASLLMFHNVLKKGSDSGSGQQLAGAGWDGSGSGDFGSDDDE